MNLDRKMLEVESTTHEELAERLSSAIENYLKQRALDVSNRAKNVLEQFYDRVNQANSKPDSGLTKLLIGSRADLIAEDPDQYSKFVSIRDFAYSGPSSISDWPEWAKVENDTQDVVALSELCWSQDGQSILLKRVFGTPEYTIAHMKRDLGLLQLHPPHPVKEVSDLTSWISSTASSSKDYVEKMKQFSMKFKSEMMAQVMSQLFSFKNEIEPRVTKEKDGLKKETDLLINQFLKWGYIPDDFRGKIVEAAKHGEQYFNLNLFDYVTAREPTLFLVALSEEFHKAENFFKLLGQENHFLPLSQIDQAGKWYIQPLFSFDFDRFDADRNKAKSAYEDELKNGKIPCPFFTRNDFPKSCTVDELKTRLEQMRNDPLFQGYDHTIMPYWVNTINRAIEDFKTELAAKYRVDRTLKWVTLCGH